MHEHSTMKKAVLFAIAVLSWTGCRRNEPPVPAATPQAPTTPAASRSEWEPRLETAPVEQSVDAWAELVASGRVDFLRVLKAMDEHEPLPNQRTVNRVKLLVELTRNDLDKLPEYLRLLDDSQARSIGVAEVSEFWAKKDVDRLLNLAVTNLIAEDRNSALFTGIDRLLMVGRLTDALDWFAQMPSSSYRLNMLPKVVNKFGEADLAGTLAWIAARPDATERSIGYDLVLPIVGGQRGADGLIQLANEIKIVDRITDTEIQRRCVEMAASSLAAQGDMEKLAAWVAALPDPLRVVGQTELLKATVDRDLPGATRLALEMQGGPGLEIIARRLAIRDPQKAADWAMSLPVASREAGVEAVAMAWYSVDADAVGRWVQTLASGPARDAAAASYAYSLARSDLEKARRIAAGISDPGRRESVLRDLNAR
jgi:hypothetical protein